MTAHSSNAVNEPTLFAGSPRLFYRGKALPRMSQLFLLPILRERESVYFALPGVVD